MASVFLGPHHGEDANGQLGVGGIGGAVAAAPVQVVDLPDDPDPIDGQAAAIVLAPGIVVGSEVGEVGDGGEDSVDRRQSEAPDPVGQEYDPTFATDPEPVV